MTIAINNGSECYVQFNCLDVYGNPFTPTSVSYQVFDTTNNLQVVSETSATPAQSGIITLTSTVNTMNAASQYTENRTAVVKIGIPLGTFQNLRTTYALVRSVGTP